MIMNRQNQTKIEKNCWSCLHNKLGSLTLFGMCSYDAKWGKGPLWEITPELVDEGCENYLHPDDANKEIKPQIGLF